MINTCDAEFRELLRNFKRIELGTIRPLVQIPSHQQILFRTMWSAVSKKDRGEVRTMPALPPYRTAKRFLEAMKAEDNIAFDLRRQAPR